MRFTRTPEPALYRILYTGPGLSGRSTSLQAAAASLRARSQTPVVEHISERGMRWRSFAFDDAVGDRRVRVQVAGSYGSRYFEPDAAWAVIGVPDAIVFVVDSQEERMLANEECLARTQAALRAHGRFPDTTPWVFQYNKRDLPSAVDVEALRAQLNPQGWPDVATVASRGKGVRAALDHALDGLRATAGYHR